MKVVEAIEEYKKNGEEVVIKNYHIPGGTSSTIEELHIGSESDLEEFVANICEGLDGWTEVGDNYELAWHSGEFFKVYNSYNDTLTQMGEEVAKDFKEESVIVWFNNILTCEGDTICLYGIF